MLVVLNLLSCSQHYTNKLYWSMFSQNMNRRTAEASAETSAPAAVATHCQAHLAGPYNALRHAIRCLTAAEIWRHV